MDSFEGIVFDPLSLHKYLYAGANPANNTDPSGQFFGFAGEALAAAQDLGVRGMGGVIGAAAAEFIRFLLIGIALITITATTIEIARRIELPIRVYHYTDWAGLAAIGASSSINSPSGRNYFTFDPYIFAATARARLATCKPLNVAIQLNVYIKYDGLTFPPPPVGQAPCIDGTIDPGGGQEMSTARPVPFWIRQPSFYPLF
jgi:hypothetical protein